MSDPVPAHRPHPFSSIKHRPTDTHTYAHMHTHTKVHDTPASGGLSLCSEHKPSLTVHVFNPPPQTPPHPPLWPPPCPCNRRRSEQRVNSRYRCRSPLDVHTTASVTHNAIAPLRRAAAVWDWRSDAMRNVCGPARFCLENNPTVHTARPLSSVSVSLTVPV